MLKTGAQSGGAARRPARVWPRWALLPAYLLLAALALALLYSYTVTELDQAYLTPMRSDDRGWEIYRLDEGGGRIPLTVEALMERTEPVCLSRVLEPAYEAAGYTTLETSGPVSAFLDGVLLYTTSPGSGESPETVSLPAGYEVVAAAETPRFTLPPGYGGRELTLVFGRGADDYGTPKVILSSRAVETAQTAVAANRAGMPAVAYLTAAFLLLGLLLYSGYQGRWDLSMLLLTLSAVLQAFYQLREYSLRLPYHSTLDIPAATLIPSLFAALPLAYLLWQMERKGPARAAAIFAPVVVSLLPVVLAPFQSPLPDGFYILCTNVQYLSIVAVLICAVCEARGGNGMFRLFLAVLGSLLGVLIVACLCFQPVSSFVAMLLTQALKGSAERLLYWCGAVLFALCAVMSVEKTIRRAAESRSRADMLSAQVAALAGRVEAARAAEEVIRIARHDLRHQLQAVAALAERGDGPGVLECISAAQTRLEECKGERLCTNPVLDAILSSYFAQAKRMGITVEYSLAIPDELPVDAGELSTVFANALENAIHACAGLPQAERRIVCRCINRPRLMVEVVNSYAGEVRFGADGIPRAQQPGHGLGTRSIAAFCQKYGAFCAYEAEEGWFRLKLAL